MHTGTYAKWTTPSSRTRLPSWWGGHSSSAPLCKRPPFGAGQLSTVGVLAEESCSAAAGGGRSGRCRQARSYGTQLSCLSSSEPIWALTLFCWELLPAHCCHPYCARCLRPQEAWSLPSLLLLLCRPQELEGELEEKRALLEGLQEVHTWKMRQRELERCVAWGVVLDSERAVQVGCPLHFCHGKFCRGDTTFPF